MIVWEHVVPGWSFINCHGWLVTDVHFWCDKWMKNIVEFFVDFRKTLEREVNFRFVLQFKFLQDFMGGLPANISILLHEGCSLRMGPRPLIKWCYNCGGIQWRWCKVSGTHATFSSKKLRHFHRCRKCSWEIFPRTWYRKTTNAGQTLLTVFLHYDYIEFHLRLYRSRTLV